MYLVDRPDAESLPRAYTDYYTHEEDEGDLASRTRSGLVDRLINGYLNARFQMHRRPSLAIGAWLFGVVPPWRMKLDRYGRHVPKALCGGATQLLDIGCGNGTFLLRARDMGIRAQGCEPDAAAAEICRLRGLDVTIGDIWKLDHANDTFDLVTLNHVIEHLPDAPQLLAKVYDLLKPGGVVWLALPNPSALGVRVFGCGWKGFHPPFHLLIPSRGILRAWIRSAGFVGLHFIRRGPLSPGNWCNSVRIAQREGTAPALWQTACIRLVGDVLSTVTSRWSEETVVAARKPAQVGAESD